MTDHTDPNNQHAQIRPRGGAVYNLSQLTFIVMLTSTKPMTPASLVDEVAPYLKAMADFQHIINEVKRRPWPEVELVSVVKDSIAQNSPISAKMKGVVDAVAFMHSIITWRRKYGESESSHNGNLSPADIQQAKVQLALEILEKASPHLDEFQKINYVSRLLPPLGVLVSSMLEVGAYDSEDM